MPDVRVRIKNQNTGEMVLVKFRREPTEADIDEAARNLGLEKKPPAKAPVRPVERPKPVQRPVTPPVSKKPAQADGFDPLAVLGRGPITPSAVAPASPAARSITSRPITPPVAPPKPLTKGAVTPPSPSMDKRVADYIEKYLTEKSGKGEPHRLMREYIALDPKEGEKRIAGISEVGKRAIRHMARVYKDTFAQDTEDANARASAFRSTVGLMPDAAGSFGSAGVGEMPRWSEAARAATALVTRQPLNDAMPLGFDPTGALLPREGFGGHMRGIVSDLGQPLNLAMLAGGTALGGAPAVARALSLLGVVPVGQALYKGDYGGALAEAIGSFGPDALISGPSLARRAIRGGTGALDAVVNTAMRPIAAADVRASAARRAANAPRTREEAIAALRRPDATPGGTPDAVQVQSPDAGLPRQEGSELGLRQVEQGDAAAVPPAGEGQAPPPVAEAPQPPRPQVTPADSIIVRDTLEARAAATGTDLPPRGSVSEVAAERVAQIRQDADLQARLLEDARVTKVENLNTDHQYAAALAADKIWQDIEAGDWTQLPEFARLQGIVAMVGSRKGWELAAQKYFSRRIDPADPNVHQNAAAAVSRVMQDVGASPETIVAVTKAVREKTNQLVKAHEDVVAKQNARAEAGKTPQEARATEIESRISALKDRINEKLGRTINAGIDPELLLDIARLGAEYIKLGVTKFPDWANKLKEDYGNSLTNAHIQEAWLRAKQIVASEKTQRPVPTPESFADELAGRIGGRDYAIAFMEKLREDSPDTLDKILRGEKITDNAEAARVQEAWDASRPVRKASTPKPGPLAEVRRLVVESRKAAADAKKAGKANPKTALELLTSRYGDKRGTAIHNDLTPELRTALENGSGWTPDQLNQAAAVFEKHPATTRKPSTDPRMVMLRQASLKASQKARRLTDAEVRRRTEMRLDALGDTATKPVRRQRDQGLSQAVILYRDGAKSLERFKESARQKYPEITEERLNELFTDAAAQFEADNAQVKVIQEDIARTLGREAFKARGRLAQAAHFVLNFQNLYRGAALGLDFGIGATQLGLVAASRPLFSIASLPAQARASKARRLSNAVLGGSRGKSGGWVKAMYRAFGSDVGAARAQAAIDATEKIRHHEGFYEETKLRINPYGLDPAGTISGESFTGPNPLFESRLTGPIYQRFERAINAGLNHSRVALFEMMMEPFMHLAGEQKLQAGKVVAQVVNVLTGGPTYAGGLERALSAMGNALTAPRFYASNVEFAAPPLMMGRATIAAHGRHIPPGTYQSVFILPPKERARLIAMAGSEYARIAASMTALKIALAPLGVEVVTDTKDKDFGNARLPGPTKGTEVTIPLMGHASRYMSLFLRMAGASERDRLTQEPFKATTSLSELFGREYGEEKSVDPLRLFGSFVQGKGTVFTQGAIAALPSSRHPEYPERLDMAFHTLPGGRKVTAAEPDDMMLQIGGWLMPAPLVFKQFTQNYEMITGAGNSEEGKRLLAALAGKTAFDFLGKQSNLSLTPEAQEAVPGVGVMRPSERAKERVRLMREGG